MRYYMKEPDIFNPPQYGKIFSAGAHPAFWNGTVYKFGDKGLVVIQQRLSMPEKHTYWGPVDDYLVDEIYKQPGFLGYFEKYARPINERGLYPTVTVRQIMWALRMKPLKKEKWETVFDRCPI